MDFDPSEESVVRVPSTCTGLTIAKWERERSVLSGESRSLRDLEVSRTVLVEVVGGSGGSHFNREGGDSVLKSLCLRMGT